MQQNFTIMKKIIILTLMAVVSIAASAQTKKVSILGDSYSTFQGVGPSHYAPFYPNDRNDVKEVDQTWWSLFIKAKGYQLEKNDSWGGTTICGTGYGRMDSSRNNFISRVDSLGNRLEAPTMPGPTLPWANTSIPTGPRKTARTSVRHSPVCLICFRSAIPRQEFVPC